MSRISIHDKDINRALVQFVFPFSFLANHEKQIMDQLESEEFIRFELENTDLETSFYGSEYKVSHKNMEHYYLPFTANVLFPKAKEDSGFQRFSKNLSMEAKMKSEHIDIPFIVHSIDIFICPFQLGLLTIRAEITKEKVNFNEAIEFASRFRVLENRTSLDKESKIHYKDQTYNEVENFIFSEMVRNLTQFFNKADMSGSHFETMSYFIDERMYVQAFFSFVEGTEIENVDLFRAGYLDGLNHLGEACIGSSNKSYIDQFVQKKVYERWAPNTYFVTDEHIFACLTNQPPAKAKEIANQLYGEYYYGLILNLFHKIVLLKLSNQYSKVNLNKNDEEIEDLIRSITHFSAKYFFLELATQTQGREVFSQLRNLFGSQELYTDVKDTLTSLFQYQDKLTSIRDSYLLLILTVFTVISGIFGMNLVIDDLKGNITWSKMSHYSIFEDISLAVVFLGISISIILGLQSIVKWFKKKRRQQKGF